MPSEDLTLEAGLFDGGQIFIDRAALPFGGRPVQGRCNTSSAPARRRRSPPRA